MNAKIRQYLFLACIALLVLLPALSLNTKNHQVSLLDNRMLMDISEVTADNFSESMNSYLSDRIGFRSRFIQIYQIACDALFDKFVHPVYVKGTNGQIYDTHGLVDYQHLHADPKYISALGNYLKAMQNLCEDYGADYTFLYLPNKESIYPEDFPEGYNIQNIISRSDAIAQELGGNDVHYIRMKDYFLTIRDDYLLYNKKYDSSHWSETGAFLGNQYVINQYLSEHFPNIGQLTSDEFDVETVVQMYLSESDFPINDPTPHYVLKSNPMTEDTESYFSDFPMTAHEYRFHYTNPSASSKPRILLVGDSYLGSSGSQKYYQNHCSELILMHSSNYYNIPCLISYYKPDIVIYEVVERAIQLGASDWSVVSHPYYLSTADAALREEIPCSLEMLGISNLDNVLHVNKEYNRCTISGILDSSVLETYAPDCLALDIDQNRYFASFNKETGSYTFIFPEENANINNMMFSLMIFA